MQKITPFLWFDNNAEVALNFYTTVFKNSKVTNIMRSPEGEVITASFELEGQNFVALNGGPHFKFTEAISFVVTCDSQAEIDNYWEQLTADGGQESRCGWLKDKFGLSWQIVPRNLSSLLQTSKGMQAMMKMNKLNIAELEAAAN